MGCPRILETMPLKTCFKLFKTYFRVLYSNCFLKNCKLKNYYMILSSKLIKHVQSIKIFLKLMYLEISFNIQGLFNKD